MINYDEANLNDDPGKTKLNFRRGFKNPKRYVEAINNTFKNLSRSFRQCDTPQVRRKRVKVKMTQGKSVEVKDFDDPAEIDRCCDEAGHLVVNNKLVTKK